MNIKTMTTSFQASKDNSSTVFIYTLASAPDFDQPRVIVKSVLSGYQPRKTNIHVKFQVNTVDSF